MSTVLTILIIVAMIATMVMLVRGVIIFLRTTEQDLKGEGPSASGMKQNKAMQMRILFQAIAIILVVLLLLLYSGGS